jgi:hypothetical protein
MTSFLNPVVSDSWLVQARFSLTTIFVRSPRAVLPPHSTPGQCSRVVGGRHRHRRFPRCAPDRHGRYACRSRRAIPWLCAVSPRCGGRREHAIRQTDRQDLVGADGAVACGVVHHVVEAVSGFMPEQAIEALAGMCSHGVVALLAGSIPIGLAISAIMRRALYHSAWISTGLPRRGVTTHSPILTSIQVSWTLSSPARSNPSSSMPIP